MTYFALVALINTISSASLGCFVYFKNKKSPINRAFFYYSISITLWSFGYYLWQIAGHHDAALLWCKVLTASAILIPVFYSQFVNEVIGRRANKFLAFFLYACAVILLGCSFSTLLVKDVAPILSFKFWPIAGPLYGVYLLLWVSVVVYSIILLLSGIKYASGQKRVQLIYITIATVVGYAGGATNFPLWYHIHVMPWGNILITFYAIAVSYAIIKLKMLNIRVLNTEAMVLVMLIALIVDALTAGAPPQTAIRLFIVLGFGFIGYRFIKNVFLLEDANKQLREDKERLKELDKLKDDFISMASHELNTPISAIKGYLSMVLVEKLGGEIPVKAQGYLETVFQSAQRLSGMVNDLLNVSRIESGRIHLIWERKPIEEVIHQAITEVASKAREAHHTLTFEEPKQKMPLTWFDGNRITEVLINLLGNAIKYTPNGGKIVVNAGYDTNNIVMSVKDNGKGIPKDKADRVFGKFSQVDVAKDEHKGTGLGMFISKKLIELHRGEIWFQSDGEGKGTTFFFSLPILTKKPFDPNEGEGGVLPQG